MKKFPTYLVLLGLLMATQSIAQNKDLRWGLGIHPTILSFHAKEDGFLKGAAYEPGVQFSINHYFNPSFDYGLEATFGNIRHADTSTIEGELDRAFFFDASPFVKYKLSNGYILPENYFISPYLKGGLGLNKHRLSSIGLYLPVSLGLDLKVTPSAWVTLQSGFNLGLGSSSYVHHSIGVVINFNGPAYQKIDPDLGDVDKDGIPDYLDRCPRIKAEGSTTGCPDLDRDGVLDLEDQCPTVKGFSNLSGCLDSDMDGLADPVDQCPNDFGPKNNKGCPTHLSDNDGDNISDKNDKCPNQPGVFTAGGCPDGDSDGVEDVNDECPTMFGEVRFAGCPYDKKGMSNLKKGVNPDDPEITLKPRTPPTVITQPSTTTTTTTTSSQEPCNVSKGTLDDIGHAVQFDSDKAKLKLSSKAELDKIVLLMKNCTDATLLIRAHTDDDGDADYNKRLSERRAYAVSRHLTRQGIDRGRVSTEGLGEAEPIVPNDSEMNKAENRRIEFVLIRR